MLAIVLGCGAATFAVCSAPPKTAAPGRELAAQKPPGGSPRLGINLAGVQYWSTEHPFANLAKHASRWRTQRTGQPFTWDDPLPPLAADGYPGIVPDGTVLESFLLATEHRAHLPAELVVLYDGKGRLEYTQGARLKTRSPGRDVIEDLGSEHGPLVAQLIETDAADPLRNVRLYEPAVAASPRTFRSAFLERWQDMTVLRFMDWMETNNATVRTWNERPRPDRFTYTANGVALETMVELANVQKAAPWFCMPHLADDEYVRRFAQQVRQTLDPALPVYVEYSNEVWNPMFEQARHAAARGLALGLSNDPFEAQLRYYSRRSSEVIRIWEDVFAEQKDRVIGVFAAQSANPRTSVTVLGWEDAAPHADVLAIAPYFGHDLGDPSRTTDVSTWSLDRLFEALRAEVAGENRKMITRQAQVAREFGVKLVAYEGGQHLVGFGGAENDAALEQLFQAANRDPRMKDLYLAHLAHWQQAGGDLYVLFNSMGAYSKWGSWGLLESEEQAPATSPKWLAVEELLRTLNAAKTPGP